MECAGCERRHSSLDYRSPMEYLINEGIVPRTLAENGVKSGSASRAQTLAYSSFDENFENFADATGEFGEAEITGSTIGGALLGQATVEFRAGVKDNGVHFPGGRGLILGENLVNDHDYTVAFWVNIATFTDHTTTFFACEDIDSWVSFVPKPWWHNPGEPAVWSHDNGAWITFNVDVPAPLSANRWYHIALVVDKGNTSVYINGQAVPLTSIEGLPLPNFSSRGYNMFVLGVNFWDPPFQGMIDELWIFDRPLNAEEVKALYKLTY